MGSNISLYLNLRSFQVSSEAKQKARDLNRLGYKFRILSTASDSKAYVKYVRGHAAELPDENLYLQNGLGKVTGETILVFCQKHEVVASLGPNRIEREGKRRRGKMGYFAVLPKFRRRGIGTILWSYGLKRLKAAGADFVKCSVARGNISARKVYTAAGMKVSQ